MQLKLRIPMWNIWCPTSSTKLPKVFLVHPEVVQFTDGGQTTRSLFKSQVRSHGTYDTYDAYDTTRRNFDKNPQSLKEPLEVSQDFPLRVQMNMSRDEVVLKDPLLHDVLSLAMPALDSSGDIFSLIGIEVMAGRLEIEVDFTSSWKKFLKPRKVVDFIFDCARGNGVDPTSHLKMTDDIVLIPKSFFAADHSQKDRDYLKKVLNNIHFTVQPKGPFEPDIHEMEMLKKEIPETRITADSYIYKEWVKCMDDPEFAYECGKSIQRGKQARRERELERDRLIISRWRNIIYHALRFDSVGPDPSFNFDPCHHKYTTECYQNM